MTAADDAARRPLHVLVVDDSAVARQALLGILSREPDVTVDSAADPLIAMTKMARRRPDVMVLDLEMPRMHGLEFLRKLMREDPLPVVVCSASAGEGSLGAISALEHGAVEIVPKPSLGVKDFFQESADVIVDAIRAASMAALGRRSLPPARRATPSARPQPRAAEDAPLLVAVGASTGGPEALRRLLGDLPGDAPATVIVQHMPGAFTTAFARSLAKATAMRVREASPGDRLEPGLALVAPGGRHLEVKRRGRDLLVELHDGPRVSRHRPSVDVLFGSVASAAGPRAVGVILTGMGDDGAAGLLRMRQSGAATLAQDGASCVVYGMPQAAVKRGAVTSQVPLEEMAEAILGRRARA